MKVYHSVNQGSNGKTSLCFGRSLLVCEDSEGEIHVEE